MLTEKQKMLAGEPYDSFDGTLYQERIECRKILKRLNNSIPGTDDWRNSIDCLIPNGKEAYLEPPFRCDYGSNIKLGKRFYANFNCVVLDVAEVTIGDYVMFGPGVHIYTAGHPIAPEARGESTIEFGKPVTIGNNVWLGGGVVVCPGVSIGENSVIAAGSIVIKDVPANVLVGGNPARIIREL